MLTNTRRITYWTIISTCNILIQQFLSAKKTTRNLTCYTWMCNCTIILAVYNPHICHEVLVHISGWNLQCILNCGNCIKHNYLSHLPNSTYILCNCHIYHHTINRRQHHLQLCGHNIYHHSQNMNQYILQQIPLLYDVLHKIMARISATLLNNIWYKSWHQHLLDK